MPHEYELVLRLSTLLSQFFSRLATARAYVQNAPQAKVKKVSVKSVDRADGMTTLTISLPAELKLKIAQLADGEDRSISNFLVHRLKTALEERQQEARRQADQ